MPVNILAIESSCDDTSAAVVSDGQVLSNITANQEIHATYGGVVPEWASRKHQTHIVPVVQDALSKAGISLQELDAIAFTRGPGLLGSLIVGVTFSKGLALALDIPLIEVHHMHAHVLSHFADDPKPEFPFLCLTVSGGHTEIILMRSYLEMEILGKTIDDAAGEAFDKTGKILGLPYPSGPIIDQLAQKGKPKFTFPVPVVEGLNFSFSGLKTSILYFLQKEMKKDDQFIEHNLNDVCASVQRAIVNILEKKLVNAFEVTGIREIAIAGGVSANSELRYTLMKTAQALSWKLYIPAMELCTDNAAMIGIAAWHKYQKGLFSDHSVTPEAKYSKIY
ncbi:MAG TPA: tRNA (adenosine(37)-N6)-threonylcarbamoyltransferase complex transferase subunit TsaD [Saprospiraceae bacterium]|nr:tRNA (adenosine(37)-N6)-threonylcarbamoyltransferase complex transferase subunit TsaD [Saprospiraceae bacterium]